MTYSVEYILEAKRDTWPVRGNALASGDDATDKEVEDAILERLYSGDVWAWASVAVHAVLLDEDGGEVARGSDYLGGCSYADENDFKADGYYTDMCNAALRDLRAECERLPAALQDLRAECKRLQVKSAVADEYLKGAAS